ncbi:MAG: hypothetical protein ABIK37_03030, partial [candidate division WOR-3 bacterium]
MHQPTTAVLSACLMLVAAGPAPAAGSLSLKRESPVPLFVVPCRELPAKPVIVAGELVGALVGSAPGSLFAVGSLAAWHSYEGRYYFGHLPLLTVPLWTTGAVFGAAGMTCLVGRAARQGGEWRPTLGAAALGGLAA